MQHLKVVFFLLGVLPLATAMAQAQRTPFFRIYDVAGQVHMLEAPGAGGNIGVFDGPDGTLLVDSRFEQDADALQSALESMGIAQVRYLINTHVHPDHIGGNAALAKTGTLIFAHESVRQRMLTRLRIPRRGGIYYDQPPPEALPTGTYDSTMSFFFNGEEVRVFLVPPAHTEGDSYVYFTGSDVLHTGDVFRTNMYPIIDKYNGGSFLGMIEAMDLAIEVAGPNTKVIPGHGFGFTDRQGLIDVRDMLLDFKRRVQTLKDQGLTVEQVLAAEPLKPYDSKWEPVPSWGAADVVPIIYAELQ